MHRRTRSSQPGFMDARSRLVSRDVILPGEVKHLMLTEYCSVLDLNPTSGLEFQASSQQEIHCVKYFWEPTIITYPTGCGQHHYILAQRWSHDALAVEPPPPVLPWRSCRVVKLSYAGITGLSLTGTLLATQMRHDWKSASFGKSMGQNDCSPTNATGSSMYITTTMRFQLWALFSRLVPAPQPL